ncbi:hypothetical protein D1345_06445 [Chromobacterium rhizoryzae]|uniref:Uncharacterized protein n=1 Tax=Chromobacterium rhizoryzae TaxID=1778675 RepID=A0AAD0RRP9_9NEIS|nr:hypothetical protein D1345_06445 [Chromobacterium rhizoryzae]
MLMYHVHTPLSQWFSPCLALARGTLNRLVRAGLRKYSGLCAGAEVLDAIFRVVAAGLTRRLAVMTYRGAETWPMDREVTHG